MGKKNGDRLNLSPFFLYFVIFSQRFPMLGEPMNKLKIFRKKKASRHFFLPAAFFSVNTSFFS